MTREKSMVIAVPLYAVTITACKISILCLYRRLFSVPAFLRLSAAIGVAIVAWGIACILTGVFICDPPKKFWHSATSGHCNNYDIAFLILEIVETVLDIVQLILPLHMISILKLSHRNKIILLFIFLSGGMYVSLAMPNFSDPLYTGFA